jgi:PIN domain nuclease of toxin-antitoxin system
LSKRATQHQAWQTVAIDSAIAQESVDLVGEFHGDPADRFIIATARLKRLAIITADRAILDYAKAGYVKAIDAAN